MIFIINSKRYNTETATKLAGDSANCPINDFNYWEEDLYMTPKGAFFLVGEGGPMTRYSKSCEQNQWTGGDGVRVLTKQEALAWLENVDTGTAGDAIEEHFSDMIENA